MANILPTRVTENALTLGTMFSTDEAFKIGLVDELAADKAEAIAKCEKFLGQFRKISPEARALTKLTLRSKAISELEESRDQDVQMFAFAVNMPQVQKGLGLYMESLKK